MFAAAFYDNNISDPSSRHVKEYSNYVREVIVLINKAY